MNDLRDFYFRIIKSVGRGLPFVIPTRFLISWRTALMATTYYYLSPPGESDVLDWFKSQPEESEEFSSPERMLLFYRQFGPLAQNAKGGVDAFSSPLISIYPPKTRRSALWTMGEVHFCSKGGLFPKLERLRRRFQGWLWEKPVVWERKHDGTEGYGYYLEGSIKNIADTVYAFPAGLSAFQSGQYFVAEHDNEGVIDTLCKALRLRGVDCG